MKYRAVFAATLLCGAFLLVAPRGFSQQDETEGQRKIVSKVVPAYPELARRMQLRGSVKLEAEVASDGTVKKCSVKGGHPVLVQAAQNAILKWRYAPAKSDTTESVEFIFDPDK